MAFVLDHFLTIRPYLFHLTAQGTLNRIVATRALEPASRLQQVNGQAPLRLSPRRQHLRLEIDGHTVWIRDQQPLRAGHIAFDAGWDLRRLLAHLDGHVFFWPGGEDGPIPVGQHHFERYAAERPALLRIPTTSLLTANPCLQPLFCRFNSGAPRTVLGRRSPRGSATFVHAEAFPGRASQVQEVVFTQPVRLPRGTQLGSDYRGPWLPLLDASGLRGGREQPLDDQSRVGNADGGIRGHRLAV
jgi:hypothetical protein